MIFLWLFTAGLLQILLYLFQVKKELMILAAGIQILGLAGMLLWEYRRKNRFYRELGDKMENLEEKYLIPEMIKARIFWREGSFMIRWNRWVKAMSDEIFAQQRKNNAFKTICGSLDP